jgi:hypothetical protein
MNKILISEGLQFFNKLPQMDRLFYKEGRRLRAELLKKIERDKRDNKK